MALAFHTLGYAKRLRERGIPPDQAEAHAEAARDFIMIHLVTKEDLVLALDNLKLSITIRLGVMLVAAVAALATIIKL
jgi:hypothetical protein